MTEQVDSASGDRTANNAVRHTYRVLSDAEKAQMVAIKDKGAEFINLLDTMRTPGEVRGFDARLNIAAERIEEAVMWAVKHITA